MQGEEDWAEDWKRHFSPVHISPRLVVAAPWHDVPGALLIEPGHAFGTGEHPTAPVFVDGKKVATLRGATVAADFKQMVIDYIERRYGQGGAGRTAAE